MPFVWMCWWASWVNRLKDEDSFLNIDDYEGKCLLVTVKLLWEVENGSPCVSVVQMVIPSPIGRSRIEGRSLRWRRRLSSLCSRRVSLGDSASVSVEKGGWETRKKNRWSSKGLWGQLLIYFQWGKCLSGIPGRGLCPQPAYFITIYTDLRIRKLLGREARVR